MRRTANITLKDAADWTADNPYLRPNEIGYERDNDQFKIGPGHWNDITDYFTKGGGGGGGEDTTTLGTLISGATAKTTPVNADLLALGDSAALGVVKKLTWANVKATLKTYFDTLYQAVLVSGTNIKTINGTSIMGSGDLTVSGGGGSGAPARSTSWHNGTTHLVTTADDRKIFILNDGTIQMPASMAGFPDGFEITISATSSGGHLLIRAGSIYSTNGLYIGNYYGSDTTISTNQWGTLHLVWSTAVTAWVFTGGEGVAWS